MTEAELARWEAGANRPQGHAIARERSEQIVALIAEVRRLQRARARMLAEMRMLTRALEAGVEDFEELQSGGAPRMKPSVYDEAWQNLDTRRLVMRGLILERYCVLLENWSA